MLNKGFKIKEESFDKKAVHGFADAVKISSAFARVLFMRGIDCESKYRYNCIMLKNASFIDEPQEYDHILVTPSGISILLSPLHPLNA